MAITAPDRRPQPAPRRRTTTLRALALVAVLCAGSFGVIVHLHRNADGSMHSQLVLERAATEIHALQDVPLRARPENGGSAAIARTRLHTGERQVIATLNTLKSSAPPELAAVATRTRAYFRTLHRIYLVGISPSGYGPQTDRLDAVSDRQLAGVDRLIGAAGRAYTARVHRAQDDALAGSGAAIALLFCAFAFFQRLSGAAQTESERFADENGSLLEASREDARTDPLTGLHNRRALVADLAAVLERRHPRILMLFDLDGFKQYNDTFGHPAGDMLLQRLGGRLHAAVAHEGGTAYRMGGDEFCVLAPAEDPERVVWTAWSALSERGDAFEVGSSYGVAEIPAEADSVKAALRIADVRMYADKAAGRPSADRQSTDVLMALVHERGPALLEHVERVAQLTELTAKRLGLSDTEARQAAVAARLHDVGMTAIPDDIIEKPGRLDPLEWEFIHRHTVIGERIIRAAPALVPVAEVVRASHERFDGTGYPDRLQGDAIPVGARIISVCDAYDTMTTDWVYQTRLSATAALVELRDCAGTQFDPAVVDAFCAIPMAQREPAERNAA